MAKTYTCEKCGNFLSESETEVVRGQDVFVNVGPENELGVAEKRPYPSPMRVHKDCGGMVRSSAAN